MRLPATVSSGWSIQQLLPVLRYPAGRSRSGLGLRVTLRGGKFRSVEIDTLRVVPEPVLSRFIALDDGMPRSARMSAGVLGWRRFTTSNVSARSAPAQMQPPPAGREAVDTAVAAGECSRINCRLFWHGTLPNLVIVAVGHGQTSVPAGLDRVSVTSGVRPYQRLLSRCPGARHTARAI